MTLTVGILIAALLGLFLGSFAGATVWRLRARQLVDDKKYGEEYDKKELKTLRPLTRLSITKDRSRCLRCSHELQWYDLVPILSWVSTKGTCRYCHKPIGWFEPGIELASAGLFASFYVYFVQMFELSLWPLLAVWAVALVLLVILFAYDAKWYILPDSIVFPLIGIAAGVAGYMIASSDMPLERYYSTLGSVTILAGLYFALWLGSKGRWVGFGDVKLGLALGLLLADWQLAFVALFLANLIGTLLVLPGLLTKKLSRRAIIPFGPLLIAGFLLALYFGNPLIVWYSDLTNSIVQSTLML